MGDILDYLSWRGDLSWEQSPFCPVDALILSALAYVHFDGLAPAGPEDPVPLGRAAERYLALPAGKRGRCRCEKDLALLRALGEAPGSGPWGCAAAPTALSPRRRPSSPL